jgi:hypothetical protein
MSHESETYKGTKIIRAFLATKRGQARAGTWQQRRKGRRQRGISRKGKKGIIFRKGEYPL